MQTSLCVSQGGSPDSGNYCDGPADLQCCVKGGPSPGKISRAEVIARAQDWVNRRIPYSQTQLTGEIIIYVINVYWLVLLKNYYIFWFLNLKMDIAKTALVWCRWHGKAALRVGATLPITCRISVTESAGLKCRREMSSYSPAITC